MVDEITLTKQATEGKRAGTLLQDETLLNAFNQLEHDYVQGWRNTDARDTDARERLWQAVQIVGKVKQHLSTMAANGKVAQRQLDELAGKKRGFSLVRNA